MTAETVQAKKAIGSSAAAAVVQCSLAIGAVNDPLEHEADAMADTVMRMPEASPHSHAATGGTSIQRKCALCGGEEKVQREADDEEEMEGVQRKPLSASITPFIQTKSNGEGATSNALTAKINNSRGGGTSIDGETKTFMESRFGADFSSVNIHTGSESIMMNRELNAKAFTVGNDIYFNEGEYNPQSDSGKHLLAHELTHTIQQGNTSATGNIQRMSVTRYSRTSGTCGQRDVKWAFNLDNPATAAGYIVQKVEMYEILSNSCPAISGPPAPLITFWEAFPVRSGTSEYFRQTGRGYSDTSGYNSHPNSNGTNQAIGTLKFFLQSTTGDIGDFSVAPATPNGGWGPGAVRRSGGLPSTLTEPSWWSGAAVEGPVYRSSSSQWDCCATPGFSNIDSNP